MAWLVTAIALFFGCWVQTALGFGMAVVAAPIVVLVAPLWVPYVLTVTALILSIINLVDHFKYLNWRPLWPAFVFRVPGTIVGLWLLTVINELWLSFFVALAVMLAVAVSLVSAHFDATPRRLSMAGFVSGVMGTTTAIGGPPMALVMQHGEPQSVRAALSLYFVFSCMLSLLGYMATGLLDWQLMTVSASYIPIVFAGFILGKRSHKWINVRRFRRLLLALCAISASVVLVGAFLSLAEKYPN